MEGTTLVRGGHHRLTEVDARDVVMRLLKSGRWEVFMSDDGRKLFLRTRGETVHTISDGDASWTTSAATADEDMKNISQTQ